MNTEAIKLAILYKDILLAITEETTKIVDEAYENRFEGRPGFN